MTEEEIASVVPREIQSSNEQVGQERGPCERLTRWLQQNVTYPVLFLALFTVVNSLLTFWVFRNLGFQLHFDGIKFYPKLLQSLRNQNMEKILIGNGIIQGLPNILVEQSGDTINLGIRSDWGLQPAMHISPGYINITGTEDISVFLEDHGRRFGSEWGILEVPIAEKLHVTDVTTSKISAGKHSALYFHSENLAKLEAYYGMVMTGGSILLEANADILLKSTNGTIKLLAGKGIYFNMEKLLVNQNVATPGNTKYLQDGGNKSSYIVCWCASNSLLFLVKSSANVTCDNAVDFCL